MLLSLGMEKKIKGLCDHGKVWARVHKYILCLFYSSDLYIPKVIMMFFDVVSSIKDNDYRQMLSVC